MTGVFFTKKQKAQIRERRLKKRKAVTEKDESNDLSERLPTKKRKLLVQGDQDNATASVPVPSPPVSEPTPPTGPQTIIVPASLDAKAARKFRKDARRKARQDGIDEALVKFVVEGQQVEAKQGNETSRDKGDRNETQRRTNKPKKVFPSIKELLKQNEVEKSKQEQELMRQKADEQLPESYKSRYVALDCEMVGIGADGKQSALARVSLVDWYGKVLLDTFVQVPTRVTDFRTHVSGVEPKHIRKQQAMEVTACREQVAAILKGKVLVGHALQNDLHALFLQHPKVDIRDTAKYRPFQRVVRTKWRPRKLRDLVKQHLGKSIQVAGESHDSVEDAASTMELFKRVREEWEKDLEAQQRKAKKKRS
jgi:RNA exonuclease 4